VGSPGTDFYTTIVGAAGCVGRPKRCDLARGIVTNDAARTVVFHLTAPDPEFLYELTEQDYTAPVPPGTSNHNTALNPIPGTGPAGSPAPTEQGSISLETPPSGSGHTPPNRTDTQT
jgi:peptide/nickel transport system substrate-binding protein